MDSTSFAMTSIARKAPSADQDAMSVHGGPPGNTRVLPGGMGSAALDPVDCPHVHAGRRRLHDQAHEFVARGVQQSARPHPGRAQPRGLRLLTERRAIKVLVRVALTVGARRLVLGGNRDLLRSSVLAVEVGGLLLRAGGRRRIGGGTKRPPRNILWRGTDTAGQLEPFVFSGLSFLRHAPDK